MGLLKTLSICRNGRKDQHAGEQLNDVKEKINLLLSSKKSDY